MNQQKNQSTPVEQPPSKLEAFNLDFEYDRTFHEIRVITRKRALP